MKTVSLTKLQQEELHHKLCIVRDEPDLLDSYEVTEEEVVALIVALPRDAGAFTFDPKYADMMSEEVDNLLDIADSNTDRVNDEDMGRHRGYISSLHGLKKKLSTV